VNFAVIVFEIKTGRGLGLPKFVDVRYTQDSMKKMYTVNLYGG